MEYSISPNTKLTSNSSKLDLTDIIYFKLGGILSRLCVSICPGKQDKKWHRSLDQDLQLIKSQQIQIIVCLLEWSEMRNLNLLEYPHKAQEQGLIFYHLPIKDMGIAPTEELQVLVPLLVKNLSNGQNILIHCRAGLGRAGTLSACCLTHFDFNPEEAINIVRTRRKGAIQTKTQENSIYNYFHRLKMT